MLKSFAVAGVAALSLAAAVPAHAAVYLAEGGSPIDDSDLKKGLSDIVTVPGAWITLDIVFAADMGATTDISGGSAGDWVLRFEIADEVVFGSLSGTVSPILGEAALSAGFSYPNSARADLSYSLTGTLASGTVLGSVTFQTAAPLVDDDVHGNYIAGTDAILTSIGAQTAAIYDQPYADMNAGAYTDHSSVDLEPVPVPAAAALLPAALAGLGLFRRRA